MEDIVFQITDNLIFVQQPVQIYKEWISKHLITDLLCFPHKGPVM